MKDWKIVKRISVWLDRSRLSHNTSQKVISLLFAILLWLFVMDQVNPEMTRELENVHVQLLNKTELAQSGLVLMDQEKEHYVNVKITGRRDEVLAASNEDVLITADLTGYSKGTISVPLEIKVLNSGIAVTDVSQKDIKVFLDRIVEIPKPVHIELVGETMSGYVRGEFSYAPSDILVKGPESEVNRVAMIYGETSIQDSTSKLEMELPVLPVDHDGEPVYSVSTSRNYVQMELPVFKLRTLSLEQRISGVAQDGYKVVNVDVNPAAVTVKGLPEHVDGITRIYTKPIDVSGISQTQAMEVELDLPEHVSAPYLKSPPQVNIHVEKIESRIYQFDLNDIPVVDLGEGLSANISELTGQVDISLTDVTSVLDQVQRDDLELIIDGSSLTAGENEVELELRMSTAVGSVIVFPKTVTINVEALEEPPADPDGVPDETGGADEESGPPKPEPDDSVTTEEPIGDLGN